jgi:uncharacterized protein YaiI (UPF0178 family)
MGDRKPRLGEGETVCGADLTIYPRGAVAGLYEKPTQLRDAMTEIYVDADACPVKDEILRVAQRHGLMTHLVSDGGIRPRPGPLVHLVVVQPGPDAADDWIAEHIQADDIAITNDIPLADRCLKRRAGAIQPNGKVFSNASIGTALATRNLMADLRERGEVGGGPAPFAKTDRSRFLQALENAIQARLRALQ